MNYPSSNRGVALVEARLTAPQVPNRVSVPGARPRIVFLNNQGLGGTGGGVTILRQLVAAYAVDHDVAVCSLDPHAPGWSEVTQITIPGPPEPKPLKWRLQPLRKAKHYWKVLPKLLPPERPLLVSLDSHFLWAIRRYRPSRSVYLSLSCLPRQEWASGMPMSVVLQYAYLERAMVRQASLTVVASRFHASEMRRFEALGEFRHVVLNPTFAMPGGAVRHEPERTDSTGAPAADVVISTLGRLVSVKNVGAVVELAARLRDVPCRFDIIGEGPERARLAQRIDQLGLCKRVRLLGNLDDIREQLAKTDIMLHPSRYESFGIAVFEAMRAGIPVLCAANGHGTLTATADFVEHGRTGLFADFSDLDAAARTLRELIMDRTLRRRLGRAAAATARTMMIQDYSQAFRQAVDQATAGDRA